MDILFQCVGFFVIIAIAAIGLKNDIEMSKPKD